MDKKWKKALCFLLVCLFALCRKQVVLAEEKAVISVQAADITEDGSVTVEIYIKNVKNFGGMDISLIYDAKQLTYVDSELQGIFAEGFGETNHIAKENTVKIVAIYPDAIEKDGKAATVTFKLKTQNMQLPTLQVNDFVDASLEIKDIPFEVQYRQADGTQSTTPEQGTESKNTENQEMVDQETGNQNAETTSENANNAGVQHTGELEANSNKNGTSEETQNNAVVQGEGEQQKGSETVEIEETEITGGENETEVNANTDNNIAAAKQKNIDMQVLSVLAGMMGLLIGVSIIRKKKG